MASPKKHVSTANMTERELILFMASNYYSMPGEAKMPDPKPRGQAVRGRSLRKPNRVNQSNH